jgi:hypothetical protein
MPYKLLHQGQEPVDSHSLVNVSKEEIENGLWMLLLPETAEDGRWNVVEEIT